VIGTVVGNYRIIEKLGDGGMGAVYRAVDELLDREVAVKVLRSELAGQVSLIERFRAEAIALARLNHPRIATLHGLERNGANFVMIMEYVKGLTLEQVVERSGKLSWVRAVEICVDICDALDHAHDKGVVHRDIKPANVMLSNVGQIKVMDFGIARVVGRDRQTQFGHAVGTPMYMAPEQLRGEDVDGRADLYALGAVLFELITGRMAFEADSDYALMMKQLNEPPTPPSALVPDVPEAVDAVVLSAMAKSREDRPANAAAMRGALRDALRGGARRPVREALPPTRVAIESRASSAPVGAPVGAPPPAAVGLPPTRIAPEVSPPIGVPPTRFADAAPPHGVPATRIGESAPVTPITATHPLPSPRWYDDHRRWIAAAIVVVAVGASAAKFLSANPGENTEVKSASGTGASGVAIVPDSSTSAARGAPAIDQPVRQAAQLPKIGGLQDPGGRGATPAAPVAGPKGGRSTGTPVPPAPKVQPPPASVPPETIATPPVSSRAPDPNAREAGFRAAASQQVEHFVQAIRDRDVATVERLLAASGTNRSVHDQLVALLRAGRVEVSDVNVTNRARAENGGSAQFDAVLNFRSPFGANRKTPAQFVLELAGDGGEWRAESVRILGAPKFR
jgi:serine/threonine-protein kinase